MVAAATIVTIGTGVTIAVAITIAGPAEPSIHHHQAVRVCQDSIAQQASDRFRTATLRSAERRGRQSRAATIGLLERPISGAAADRLETYPIILFGRFRQRPCAERGDRNDRYR